MRISIVLVAVICFLGYLITTPESQETTFEKFMRDREDEYQRFRATRIDEYRAFAEQVREKWNEYRASSRKVWVTYNSSLTARSTVDFQSGQIEVEALVDANADSAEIRASLATQLAATLNAEGGRILEGQILPDPLAPDAEPLQITADSLVQNLPIEIHPEQPGSLKGSLVIQLPPDHKQRRAKRYLPLVEEFAGIYDLAPERVLAVIDQESAFNPLGRSSAGALGLMQLIPDKGGQDAYLYIYNREWTPSEAYLFDARNNVELGTGYLRLVENRHFSHVRSPMQRLYLASAGYNWGPARVERLFNHIDINRMSDEEVYVRISQAAPQETVLYLSGLLDKIPTYSEFVTQQRLVSKKEH